MKSFIRSGRVWSVVLAGAIVAGGPMLVRSLEAQQPPSDAAGAVRGLQSAAAGAGLDADMRAMGTEFRTINTQVSDPTKNESTLKLLAQFEAHVLGAKDTTPPGAATQPADARDAYVTTFKKDLITLEQHTLETETALLDKDNDKAAKAVKDMQATEAMGHSEFRPPRGGR